jgi:hypothetical protein
LCILTKCICHLESTNPKIEGNQRAAGMSKGAQELFGMLSSFACIRAVRLRSKTYNSENHMKAYVRIILRASQGLMFDFFSNCSFLVPARQTRIVDPVYTAFRVKELHPNALQTRLFLCPPLRRSVYSTHCVPMRPEF